MVWACVRLRSLLVALAVAAAGGLVGAALTGRWQRGAGAMPKAHDDVLGTLERVLGERADALVTFDDQVLERHYDLNSVHGRWALEHERRRIRYLQAWAEKRGVRLVSASVKFKVSRMQVRESEAWLSLVQSARLGYVYEGDPDQEKHLFGIGTRHAVQLVRQGGRWLVRRDWYTDPLDEDTLIPEVTPADVSASGGLLASAMQWQRGGRPRCSPPGVDDTEELGPGLSPPRPARRRQHSGPDAPLPAEAAGAGSSEGEAQVRWGGSVASAAAPTRFNREAAVRYAREFCGAAWGCGNGGRYNPRYRDYTDIGGDCTNFTSQVLHAGGLPMTSVWYYRSGSGGSRAWVQTEALAQYLLASGRARLVGRGRYPEVMTPDRNGKAPIDQLESGDVIGYQERGRIVHLAPVTGRDFRGYVVVNSHTADRNMVPWDVGWDQATVFWLFKIRD